jgi:putative endonuclease
VISREIARRAEVDITGIDIAGEAVEDAQQQFDAERGDFKGKAVFRTVDIREAPQRLGRFSFDVVICNPPYFKAGHGRRSPDPARRRTREEGAVSLGDILSVSAALLRERGDLFMILPPVRLPEAVGYALPLDLALIGLRAVHTRADDPALRVLLHFRKGAGDALEILPPLLIQS